MTTAKTNPAQLGHDVLMHTTVKRTLVDIIQADDLFGDGWQSPRIASYNGPDERSIIAATSGSALYFAPAKLAMRQSSVSLCPSCDRKSGSRCKRNRNANIRKSNATHHRSLRTRLGSYLLTEALRHQQTTFVLPISRTTLVEYLHVDRAALSRELSSMRDDGLIDYWRYALNIQNLSDAEVFPK